MTPDGQTVLRPRDPLAWQEVAGELVLLDLEKNVLRGLNKTGARVWELCDGQRTLADIAAALATRHGLAPDAVLGDVLAFARELLARNLVELVAPQGGQRHEPAR